jgi:hypothetical protein
MQLHVRCIAGMCRQVIHESILTTFHTEPSQPRKPLQWTLAKVISHDATPDISHGDAAR